VILLSSTLELAELLFTLAHELAHYLRDYDAPRRKVADRLGPRALEVLDGLRPPTVNEQLAGVLRGVTAGAHTHHLDRDRRGRVVSAEAAESEAAADRLAYELLAPFEAVAALAPSGRAELVAALTSHFGLPSVEAAKYAAILVR
jgi:Zn-dependent peptidase ImmA (M78 family)